MRKYPVAIVCLLTHAISLSLLAQTPAGTPSAAANTAGTTTASTANPTPTPPAAAAPLCTRMTSFSIPFKLDQPGVPAPDVLLYVSADRGANWVLYARLPGPQGHFLFRSGRDAEYWFASRTVPNGEAAPAAGGLKPEIRVTVDTAQPRLNAMVTLSPAGEIQLAWEAYDETLDAQSLKIEYQFPGEAAWRPVTFQRPSDSTLATVVGQTAFRPEAGGRVVNVRVSITDRAGNMALQTRPVTVPAAMAANRPATANGPPADPLARQGLAATNPWPAPPASAVTQTPAPSGETWPSDRQVSKPTTSAPRDSTATSPPGAATAQPVSTNFGTEKTATSGPSAMASTGTLPMPAAAPPSSAGSIAGGASGPAAGRVGDPTYNPPAADAMAGLPAGERPRWTASKRFNLDYAIDAVGPAGVEKVELWITRNGGREWSLWGLDKDKESPFEVTLDSEGIYGFRVVVVGKNGLASQSPRPGDTADLWLGIDTTKPVVEITQAAYGADAAAGQLAIQWKATDAHFGAQPITLFFSDKANGSWTPFATSLPNDGKYLWRVDSRVPGQFYLKIEARDEAGNVGTHQLDKPIASAGLTPKGRVRGFEASAK